MHVCLCVCVYVCIHNLRGTSVAVTVVYLDSKVPVHRCRWRPQAPTTVGLRHLPPAPFLDEISIMFIVNTFVCVVARGRRLRLGQPWRSRLHTLWLAFGRLICLGYPPTVDPLDCPVAPSCIYVLYMLFEVQPPLAA